MSNKVRQDDSVGFSLSFLDVLSCGLGAAILLLLVVKHGSSDLPIESEAFASEQAARIQNELDQKIAEKTTLSSQVDASRLSIQRALETKASAEETQDQRVAELRQQLAALSLAQDRLQASSLELQALQAIPTEEPEPQTGPTGNLGGLKIADNRVVILLDRSASMLDRSLVEIIRLRVAPKLTRLQAEKWATARKSAQWAFDQLPSGSDFQLLAFSEDVWDLHGTEVGTNQNISWLKKNTQASSTPDIPFFLAELDANGPTNLEKVFRVVATLRPKPKQVLLISDGHPTVPESKPLQQVSSCPFPRRNQTPILGPNCRRNIFELAETSFRRLMSKTELSVILLPLEGDARAMYSYWNFAATTGGRVLTPARGWPW